MKRPAEWELPFQIVAELFCQLRQLLSLAVRGKPQQQIIQMCLLHYLNGNGVENDTISHQCSTAFQRDNTLYGRAGYAFVWVP